MFLSEITGQRELVRRLVSMPAQNRLPHAMLFSGPEGSGNLAAAVAFSQYLLCKDKQAGDSCGNCPSCLKAKKLTHPDIHFSFPIALSKKTRTSENLISEFREAFLENPYLSLNDWFNEISAENKQPIIPVDESNNIIKQLSYTSFEGSYKIIIIWQPEKMNQEAANSLLKILEEPPDKTLFFLVSTTPENLLSTILSRVQQIPFFKLNETDITDALMKLYNVNTENARQIALLCGGNLNEAKKLLAENDEQVLFLQHFQTFMRLAFKFDCEKALQWIDANAATGREKQKQFVQYALEIFRDALMHNFGSPSLVRLSGSEKQFLEKFAPFITQKNYEALIEEFNNSHYYIERNANPKILFMDLLLKTNELLNKK